MIPKKTDAKRSRTLYPQVAYMLDTDFRIFVRKCFATLNGEKLGREPYLDYLCTLLTGVADGKTRRILVNIAPRHLKTFVFSVCFPAWELLRRPASKVMVVAGSESLVGEIVGKTREIIRSRWFQELSGIQMVRDKLLDFATSAGGSVSAFSIDGSITGRGADIIIVDDPVDIKDAENIERLAQINARFDTVIESRLNNPKKGRIIVVAHRLHPNDLPGHLLKAGGWQHVKLPMVATEDATYETSRGSWMRKIGDLLRPDAFSADYVEKRRRSRHSPDFDTLYQQEVSGGIAGRVTKTHIGWFPRALLHRLQLPVVLSVDPGDRGGLGNSYSVIQAWSSDGKTFYLVDQYREQCGYKTLHRAYIAMLRKHNPSVALVERTAMGARLIDDESNKAWPQIKSVIPRLSKLARFRAHIESLLEERIKLPPEAEWIEDFRTECVDFPNAPYDDQVDAMTQALDYFSENPKVPVRPRRVCGLTASKRSQCVQMLAKHSAKLNDPAFGIVVGASRGGGYLY